MNYLGHHEVARQIGDSTNPAFLLGVLIPDFAGMFGVHKLYKSAPIDYVNIRAGVELHNKTNAFFDEHEYIKELDALLLGSFKQVFARWTAVQCARVGKDILFDGLFSTNPDAVKSCLGTIGIAAQGSISLVDVVDPIDVFTSKANDLFLAGIPEYHDPTVVATRLQRRLTSSRTPIPHSAVPDVAAVFAEHQPFVFTIGSPVVESVIVGCKS